MKSSFRILAIGLALALLLVVPVNFGGTASAADIDLDNNEASWAAGTALDEEAGFYGPGPSGTSTAPVLYVRSDQLQTTESALAFAAGISMGQTNLDSGFIYQVGQFKGSGMDTTWDIDSATTTVVTVAPGSSAPASNDSDVNDDRKYNPGRTPLTGSLDIRLYSSSGSAGAFSYAYVGRGSGNIIDGPSGLVDITYLSMTSGFQLAVIEFSYDIADRYQGKPTVAADGKVDKATYTSGYQRARITSNSDSSGEWVDLIEVDGVGSDVPTSSSNYFRAAVNISEDPTYAGGVDGNVWVQDGDTLTATIYSKNGDTDSVVIATATVSIDGEDPAISILTPADGSILSKSDERISIGFTLSDSGAGFDNNAPANNIDSIMLKRDSNGDGTLDLSCPLGQDAADGLSFPSRTNSEIDASYSPNDTWASRCGSSGVVDTTGPDENHHGKMFSLEIVVTDLAGNDTKKTIELRVDTVAPSIESNGVSAGEGWDASDEKIVGKADSILVEFNESLDPDTVSEDDFDVTGFQITSAEVVGVNADEKDDNDNIVMANQDENEYVVLTLSEDLEQDSKPDVSIVGSISDEAGNARKGTAAKPVLRQKAQNALAPSVTVEAFTALLAKDGEQEISFSSNESLRSVLGTDCTCVSISGEGVRTNKQDDVRVTLSTAMAATAKFKQKSISGTGIYGVMVQAVDHDGNDTKKGATKVTDEDVSDDAKDVKGQGTIVVTPAKWPIADSDVDGTLADEFALSAEGEAVAVEATAIDWVNGKVTLKLTADATDDNLVEEDDDLRLTYKYVDAAQVIQVDTKKPTVSFMPDAGASIEHQRPIIQIAWKDVDYAGDTHKTVTLTAATLKGPDGETVDIMDLVETTDDMTWIYAPAEALALGEYTLSVSADDEAGNSNNKQTAKYTIKARPKTTIDLRAGWNLISLRGAPASLDINDVITAASVEVVSTYDASLASPWTVWTRDADGALMSTPAGRSAINPGHGLWVRSSNGEDLKVDIPGLSRDDLSTLPPIVELSAGWNLVAASSVDPSVKTLDPDVYFHGLEWVRVYEYNTLTGRLEGALPMSDAADDTDNDEFIDIGKGYWVYLSEPGTLVP